MSKYTCLVCLTVFPPDVRRGRSYCDDCREPMRRVRDQASMIARASQPVHARYLKCVDCGKWASHYDHRYYLKPTEVVPVCISCNLKRGPALDVREAVLAYIVANGPVKRPLFNHIDYT